MKIFIKINSPSNHIQFWPNTMQNIAFLNIDTLLSEISVRAIFPILAINTAF